MSFISTSRTLLRRVAAASSYTAASRPGVAWHPRFYADNAAAGTSDSSANNASATSSPTPTSQATAPQNDVKDLGASLTSTMASSLSKSSKGEPSIPGMDPLQPGPSKSPGRSALSQNYRGASYGQDQEYTLHVRSTRNNVQLTYTQPHPTRQIDQKVFRTITGGSDKDFKKSNRSSYEAAHQAAIKTFGMIEEHVRNQSAQGEFNVKIKVAFRGMFGQGREAVTAALTGPEGVAIQKLITSVEDRTPIKIGGTRPKKQRRL